MTYQMRLKQRHSRHRGQLARINKKCNRAVSANVIVDGAAGSRTRSPPAPGAMWLSVQAITADYNDMIYAATREEVGVGARPLFANGGSSIAPPRTAGNQLHPSDAEPMAKRMHR
jgi:hypothetical protein